MNTGDKELDAINDAIADAFRKWQADPSADNAQALADAENKKVDYITQSRAKHQQDYMKRFMASR